ncbi:M35 family metallo-endopeptidase [uncultured Massilia sp.]|uniref:M35 family metallo-endopeptidase n=1 Tax=uncultured Massilia sp. TaxID=169973 RepID=UPI0026015651|nr:M35 family metallo-endopeptidase [uncultured Massilia sp.]
MDSKWRIMALLAGLAGLTGLATVAHAAPGGVRVAVAQEGVRVAVAQEGVRVAVAPQGQDLAASDDVVVTVTMTNTTGATQYLLAWQTPFGREVEAPLFEVMRDGAPVPYLGIQAKRPAPRPSDYIALAPGASRSASVELSALYDMRAGGAYSVRWRAGAARLYSRPGTPQPGMLAEPEAPAIVRVARQPGAAAATPALPPAPAEGGGLSYSRCSNAQQGTIVQAVEAAQAMAQDGEAYMQKKALAARYTGWFGAVEAQRATTVAQHFAAIREAFQARPVTVDCGCNEAYYAYVYPNQPYRIYVCRAFWDAPPAGTDSQGGTLVHEMSHFTVVAGTDDWAYGQDAAAALAADDPARAVDNADSHEYFGENTPYQAKGSEVSRVSGRRGQSPVLLLEGL